MTAAAPMETWFLRKEDGAMYGPADLPTLHEWAAAARVEPSDVLSQDQKNWIAASQVPELEMNWLVELEAGEAYGPIHVRALLELGADGTLPGATQVRQARDGRRLSLRALTLMEGMGVTQDAARDSRAAERELPKPSAESVTSSALPPSWQNMARERDRFQCESDRWQERYERERASSEATIRELQADLHKQSEDMAALRSALDRARIHEEQVRRQMDRHAADQPGSQGLDTTFLELSGSYETLATQLADKMAELSALRTAFVRTQDSFVDRIDYLEKQIEAERKEAQAARAQLTRSEEAYQHVVQSLRELNFHYIQFKESHSGATPSAPPAPAPESAASPVASTASTDAKSSRFPRIRLNR